MLFNFSIGNAGIHLNLTFLGSVMKFDVVGKVVNLLMDIATENVDNLRGRLFFCKNDESEHQIRKKISLRPSAENNTTPY